MGHHRQAMALVLLTWPLCRGGGLCPEEQVELQLEARNSSLSPLPMRCALGRAPCSLQTKLRPLLPFERASPIWNRPCALGRIHWKCAAK